MISVHALWLSSQTAALVFSKQFTEAVVGGDAGADGGAVADGGEGVRRADADSRAE
jgi:hypothetical protein